MSDYAPTAAYDAVIKPNPALDIPAVKRCAKAWKKAYRDEYREDRKPWDASEKASYAFCAALPPLTSRENCRDFVACVAYGITLKAVAEKDAGKLIYAAQVALLSFANEKNPQKSPGFEENRPEIRANSKEKQ